MGLSASQGRLLLLTAQGRDLEFRAQQISQKRLILSQQLEEISMEYENATSNRQMKIALYLNGESQGQNAQTLSTNLTYSALISGTSSIVNDPKKAGIQYSDNVGKSDYSSTSAYRLVSSSGAIVVSDISEIPINFEDTTDETSAATNVNGLTNVYKPTETNVDLEGNETTVDGEITIVAGQGISTIKNDDGTETTQEGDSDLLKAFKSADEKEVHIDLEEGIVRLKMNGKDTYYNVETGQLTETPEKFTATSAVLTDTVPQNVKYTTSQTGISSYEELEENYKGRDGSYRVPQPDGTTKTYIVDPALAFGSTDPNCPNSGPNYLQDCLRNGKYLIEKYTADKTIEGGYKWSNLSWDATANISDHYYTEDDDAAKAKYDRLQSQIQAQDKKLELELDNIETQRNAVTTEIESVEKVISEDIEGTFNAFG